MDSTLLVALAPAIIVAIVGFLVHRHIISKGTVADIYHYAGMAALAAEEIHGGGGTGAEKMDMAKNLVLERFGVSEEEADAFVNSAVNALREAGYIPPTKGKE